MIIDRNDTTLKLDKHPFSGFARIMIDSYYVEDDGFGGFEEFRDHATIILSKDECIKIVNELNRRIDESSE